MTTTTGQRTSEKVSAKAEEAFADYLDLGPGRSYRALAAEYVKQKRYKTETTAFNQIAKWAGEYGWQHRIASAATERSTAKLEAAAELDADTFLETSRLLNERIKWTTTHDLDAVVKTRESVRKPMPKGGASVSVNVSVEVRHLAEQLAQEMGLSADDLLAEAESIAQREWSKAGRA